MDITIDLGLGKEAGGDVILSVDFRVTDPGAPAHMGDLNYPGHPAEPMEVEIDFIFWPVKKWDATSQTWKDSHVAFPHSGLPDAVFEAIVAHICEHYDG